MDDLHGSINPLTLYNAKFIVEVSTKSIFPSPISSNLTNAPCGLSTTTFVGKNHRSNRLGYQCWDFFRYYLVYATD
jgi:hypothetical protein